MEPDRQAHTTAAVQQFLDDLAVVQGASSAASIVRALLARSVRRLHLLCVNLLYRSYPRLARPPRNLQADELVSTVVERLLKAMENVRPPTVRQFFALANQHMRWELNDLARRLDEQVPDIELRAALVAAPSSSESELSPNARRMLEAIDNLPEDEREMFSLVRLQGMTHNEAAKVVGVSFKTVGRRLNRSLILLEEMLADLRPASRSPGKD